MNLTYSFVVTFEAHTVAQGIKSLNVMLTSQMGASSSPSGSSFNPVPSFVL